MYLLFVVMSVCIRVVVVGGEGGEYLPYSIHVCLIVSVNLTLTNIHSYVLTK